MLKRCKFLGVQSIKACTEPELRTAGSVNASYGLDCVRIARSECQSNTNRVGARCCWMWMSDMNAVRNCDHCNMASSAIRLASIVAVLCVGVAVVGGYPTDELDFKTELAQRQAFSAADFIFQFTNADTSNGNGNLRGLFVNNDAALATLPGDGVSQNLVTMEACAINQPHNHPRGTEISHVTKGTFLFGFAEENGGRFIGGNVTQGQTVFIPQGLIHFAQNLECQEAQFIASFPNRDPGTVTTARTFFEVLPLSAIRATTGLTDSQIATIQASITANPNPSLDKTCAQRCGIKY